MNELSLLLCLLAMTVVAFLPIRLLGRFSWYDVGFLVTMTLAVIYLFASPTAALFGNSLEKVSSRSGNYVLFQFFALVLFIFPFTFIYAAVARRHLSVRPVPVRAFSSTPVLVLIAASVVLRFLIATRYGLWRLRIGETVADRVVAAPFVLFSIFRALSEIQFPLIALGLFLVLRERRVRTRRVGFVIVAAHVGECLLFAVLNSRFAVLYLLIALVIGVFQNSQPEDLLSPRILRRAYLGIVVAYVLGLGVLTLRSGRSRGGLNVIGDSQGLNRFNCADLIAQTNVTSFQASPKPAIWDGYAWTFRRFLDPAGFDRFRLSLQTTAKSQISARFLNVRHVDYYSCVATDAVGGLGVPGFLVLALVLGFALGTVSRILRRGTPVALALAAVLLFHVSTFDQEFGSVVFSWPLKIPGLALIIGAAWMCDRGQDSARAFENAAPAISAVSI